ncbi:MAG: hypothetical protein AAFP70_14560, partial [Calditrichota bacterium]
MKSILEQAWRLFCLSGTDLLNLLLPSTCLHCGMLTQKSIHASVCSDCLSLLRPLSPGFGEQQILSRLQPCYIDEMIIGW